MDRPRRRLPQRRWDVWATAAGHSSFDVTTFAELRSVGGICSCSTPVGNSEYAASHIGGATHIPLHELLDRLDDVPDGRGPCALPRAATEQVSPRHFSIAPATTPY